MSFKSKLHEYSVEARAHAEGWLLRDAIAIDDFCNVFFMNGMPDETLSAHLQRLSEKGNPLAKMVIGWLDEVQKDHGQLAVQDAKLAAEKTVKVEKKAQNAAKPGNNV